MSGAARRLARDLARRTTRRLAPAAVRSSLSHREREAAPGGCANTSRGPWLPLPYTGATGSADLGFGLLERRRRAERALTTVVATCYLLGVSTRRMEKLVESLGITRLSKSQVSEMARDLDAQVEQFRTRPLDAGPYTFAAAERTGGCS